MMLDERIQGIFSDVFGIPREAISPDSSPETIDTWDSLQHLNLVLALEQEFQVQFTAEEIETLVSPAEIARLVSEKMAVMEMN